MAGAQLTAYEEEREARVARNKRIMEALGLFSHDLAAVAMRNKAEQAGAGGGKKSTKRKAQAEPAQPTRRSRRLDGTAASEAAAAAEGEEGAPDDEHLAALHEAEAAAWSARHAGKQCRATVVGTASYNHTLMRVRTMSEDALLRRVATIERAKGKHAVIKTRMFARVAFLEGYDSVADAATEALQRLVELLGDMPDEDEPVEGDAQ